MSDYGVACSTAPMIYNFLIKNRQTLNKKGMSHKHNYLTCTTIEKRKKTKSIFRTSTAFAFQRNKKKQKSDW